MKGIGLKPPNPDLCHRTKYIFQKAIKIAKRAQKDRIE